MRIVYFICCLILFSCNKLEEKEICTINVADGMKSLQSLSVTDLAETISYVPLETTDSSLIGDRPYIRKIRNRLLVASEGCPLMMFDAETGKFIRKVGDIGQAEGEYLLADNIPVFWGNEKEGTIFVKTAGNKILTYDIEGNYIDSWNISSAIDLNDCSQIISDGRLFVYKRHLFSDKRFDIWRLNLQDRQIEDSISEPTIPIKAEIQGMPVFFNGFGNIPASPACYIFSLKDNGYAFHYKEDPCLWNFQEKAYLKERFNDTIFQIKGDRLFPQYRFDLGDKQWPYDKRYSADGMADKVCIDYVLEGTKSLFFMFKTNYFNIPESRTYWGVYNKGSHILKISDVAEIKDSANNFLIDALHSATSDGTIIGLISVENYLENTKRQDIKEDDNPIAVLMK